MSHKVRRHWLMKAFAQVVLLGLLAIFTLVVSGLFASKAYAQDVTMVKSAHYLMVRKVQSPHSWENNGTFASYTACRHAAVNQMRIPLEAFACVAIWS